MVACVHIMWGEVLRDLCLLLIAVEVWCVCVCLCVLVGGKLTVLVFLFVRLIHKIYYPRIYLPGILYSEGAVHVVFDPCERGHVCGLFVLT